ncbi:MAG: putative S-layer protein [Nanoarchaeota archaeon]|nr:putative S-layer protein [Nanoarchaeota archaeon]
MKAKFTLTIAVLMTAFSILFAATVSAALQLETVSVPTSAVHTQVTVPITFKLTNTGTTAQTGLNWDGSTTNIGTWTLSGLPTTINAGNSVTLQFTPSINIPKHQSGTINANLKVVSQEGETDDAGVSIEIAKSATLTLTKTKELTSSGDGEITVANTGNVALTNIELTSSGNIAGTFSKNNLNLIPGKDEKNIVVSASDLSNLKFGVNTLTVSAKDLNENAVSNNAVFTISNSFCKAGAKGDLRLNDVTIESSGEDEEEWKVLDEITVEVEIENEGDDEVENVLVELALFDSNGNNVANDLDFENEDEEEIDFGDLNDGDEEIVTFNFRIPADFEDKGNFRLAIKAYSEDAEELQCADKSSDFDGEQEIFKEIEIKEEDDEGKFIVFDNIAVQPTEAVCGDNVKIIADAFNVGNEEQDQTRINLVNSKLNVDLSREIKEDLNEGDKKRVEFEFVVPENSIDGTYNLELSADYDYRSGTYRESSDDSTTVQLKVFGCKAAGNPPAGGSNVAISATLDSDAKAGEELTVKTTITNLGSSQADFVITAVGFETWAELSSISERLINLKSGETKEVIVVLNVNPEAEGENTFALEVRSGDKLESREIAVQIEEAEAKPAFGFDFGGNSLVWIIGLINIILIVLIIVVAARISRR